MSRNKPEYGSHPELEILLAWRDERLEDRVAAEVQEHLYVCPLCRLALKQADRFDELDQDHQAAAEADWARAQQQLVNPWPGYQRRAGVNPWRERSRWLVPLAAAAVLAVVAVNVGQREISSPFTDTVDSVRGGAVVEPVIEAVFPRGELDTIPAHFEWKSEREFEGFDLELFAEDLKTVMAIKGITAHRADIPDSVLTVLQRGHTYFWHVKDGAGLTAQEASETVWFRVGPEK